MLIKFLNILYSYFSNTKYCSSAQTAFLLYKQNKITIQINEKMESLIVHIIIVEVGTILYHQMSIA